jgi:hypothetical protein
MNLKEKLIAKRDRQPLGEPDWNRVRANWISSVEGLYSTIIGWLDELHKEGLVTFNRREIILSEEHLGSYPINALEIGFFDTTVIAEPQARNVIGAEGRVDLFRRGEIANGAMLILNRDEQGGDQWYFAERLRRGAPMPLTQRMLTDKLNEWID